MHADDGAAPGSTSMAYDAFGADAGMTAVAFIAKGGEHCHTGTLEVPLGKGWYADGVSICKSAARIRSYSFLRVAIGTHPDGIRRQSWYAARTRGSVG
jgi:hypothetical protein